MCLNPLLRSPFIPQGLGDGLSDCDLLQLLRSGRLKSRELDPLLSNPQRAVRLRRGNLCELLSNPHVLERLPFRDFDYRFVQGQCCEEVCVCVCAGNRLTG